MTVYLNTYRIIISHSKLFSTATQKKLTKEKSTPKLKKHGMLSNNLSIAYRTYSLSLLTAL